MTPDPETAALAFANFLDRAAPNLSQEELFAIAYAAAMNLDSVPMAALLDGITPLDYPGPPVSLDSLMDWATDWASSASPDARDAIALAAFNALPSARKVAFLNHVMAAAA